MLDTLSFSEIFHELGYHDLVAVEAGGKAPAIGRGWQFRVTTPEDVKQWDRRQLSIGIRTGRSYAKGETDVLVGVDADALELRLAERIRATLCEVVGISEAELITRIGQAPKAFYFFRMEDTLGVIGGKVKFVDQEQAKLGKPGEVEVRGNGLQFVAFGTHPTTGKPYTWPNGLPPKAELPLIGQEQVDRFMDLLNERLPKAHARLGAGKPAADQASLSGRFEMVADALRWIPNGRATSLPGGAALDYDGWVALAYAVKAACGEDGWPLFEEFSGRWTDGVADSQVTRSTWKGARGPFRVGAAWIYEAAALNSGGAFSKFEALKRDGGGANGAEAKGKHAEVPGEPHPEPGGDDGVVENPPVPPPPDLSEPFVGGDNALERADFVAYMPQHTYIFRRNGEPWPAASVNARVAPVKVEGLDKPMPANVWLDRHQAVEQMTWAPGEPPDIKGRLVSEGGWFDSPNCNVYNLYRPPILRFKRGDAGRWVDHMAKLYGDDAAHLTNWVAHRVQFPGEKINHAVVVGGKPGTGKDTLFEPVKRAVGPWNFREISPINLLDRFNPFLKSVILRVSEARDLGEVNRFAFYEHTKAIIAAPPDVLRIDEKHIREYSIFNVCGVVITSNNKTNGVYLPAEDRRPFVAWSDVEKEEFDPDYWTSFYHWYDHGGYEIVGYHLAEHDLTEFNPKAPPPQTEAFWEIVEAGRAAESTELMTVLELLQMPEAITVEMLKEATNDSELQEWLKSRHNRKAIAHQLEECGYVRVRNPGDKQGMWKIHGKKMVIYARINLSVKDRIAAAQRLR